MNNDHLRLLWLNNKFKLALLVLITMSTLSVTFYTLHYYPFQKKLMTAESRQNKARSEVSNSLKLKAITSSYMSTMREVELLEEKLSVSLSQSEVSRQVNKVAKNSRLHIKTESDEIIKNSSSPAWNFKKLSILGSYKAIRRFISGVNNMDLLIIFDETSLKRKSNGSISGNVTLVYRVMVEQKNEK